MGRSGSSRQDFRRQTDRAMLVLYANVVESLGWATVALLDQDLEVAERVIEGDRKIDDQAGELTGLIKERLADVAVEPDELEELISVLQMVPELERSADLAEHIAQRARQDLGGAISPRARGIIQSMCDVGIRMWQLSTRAFAERSRDLSFDINEADDELDSLSVALLREGAAGGVEPAVAAELALIARFYERLGDHAVNLARRSSAIAAPARLTSGRWAPGRRTSGRLFRRRPAREAAEAARGLGGRLVRGLGRLGAFPGDDRFLELFERLAANIDRCGAVLVELVNDPSNIDERCEETRGYERQGDQLTIEVLRRLDSALVTTHRREDIHALAEALDDVLDAMLASAAFMQAVRIDGVIPEVKQQAENLAAMAVELGCLIGCLRSRQGARRRLERIGELEHDGDVIHRRSMSRLFSGDYDALEVLKWKDIVASLEEAMNQIEEASDVVESILVKAR
ncbi:MAG: DUF47 family protein [Acidobacteriota bacterium]|nr:DUF47 family protein [Acidobacteriota bacterium]